jgi:RNA polymerase sigma-70 factor (ECF subfamily)
LLIQAEEVADLLARLHDVERELLYLWAVEEYTIDEISELTGAPRGTLLSRLHRLRGKLLETRPAAGEGGARA